ncbi:expressed unknown protein [Seminavis robusta]|uniref:Reverse transcriptase n=1 Tax=Seminavis robusta TaxID=568900 RepID=A0A9N8DE24_9STRA|nr:expressed unknown protein [Seminavis robusta]|eukprot:Sro112_g055520.1 n/a (352) ;mRNA; r:22401-23456
MVILQKVPHVRRTRDIKPLLTRRLDQWDSGLYESLATECHKAMESFLSDRRGSSTPEQRARRFQHLMLQGEVRRAVRFITAREQFGVLLPTAHTDDGKGTERSVLDILKSKHPSPTPINFAQLPKFDAPPPAFVDLQITPEITEQVAGKLSGACGLGGTDGPTLKNWLLRYRRASTHLRAAFGLFAQWQANNLVPWAAIRALNANRGMALDKFPGVRPIGIGNIERRYIAKCVLAVAGPAAAAAAGTSQLSVGLKAGIEGAVHTANHVWDHHLGSSDSLDSDFGFLIIDASNAFNELNRTAMLYTVRHLWPEGARFTFNSYKHWSLVIFHDSTAEQLTLSSALLESCKVIL